jgi:hypothetical protein
VGNQHRTRSDEPPATTTPAGLRASPVRRRY